MVGYRCAQVCRWFAPFITGDRQLVSLHRSGEQLRCVVLDRRSTSFDAGRIDSVDGTSATTMETNTLGCCHDQRDAAK